MLHHFSLHFFTPQVRGVYHDIQDTLTGCKNTVGTNHLDIPMPYLYHLPPNKASDMYTCCSNSVKLLVRASGCGIIVTEIAKSNHFKETFWSIFSSATETTFSVCFSTERNRNSWSQEKVAAAAAFSTPSSTCFSSETQTSVILFWSWEWFHAISINLTKPSALIRFACLR